MATKKLLAQFDKLADPEERGRPGHAGKSDIDKAADYMRFLAPQAPPPHASAEMQNRLQSLQSPRLRRVPRAHALHWTE